MKSALTVVLFRLFAIGVFADGKETSNVESVSVMEGDSVTLKSGVTNAQTVDEIEWRFSGTRIEKFGDRLQLDGQTRDLKISNIRTTDSGLYKVKISSTDGSSEIIFTVKVVSAGGVKPLTVMVGDSVTLRIDPTELQTDDVIQWRFEQQDSTVAGKTVNVFTSNGPDESFRGRLRQDSQTGSLNITNITTTDSGVYEADISTSRYTIHKSFSVTVSDAVKSVSVKEGESVTLPTVTEIQSDDLIHWMFRAFVIAEIHKAAQRFYTSEGPDGRFRVRLYLDNQTGSLIIMNTRITDSGDYQLKINSSRFTIKRRIPVTVTAVSGSGLSSGAVAGTVAGVVLVVAAAAAGVIYHRQQNL